MTDHTLADRETIQRLIARHDRPGPRYTSYPTAVEFEEVDPSFYEARLAEADALGDAPLSVYMHLPFCEERCLFCGCHVIITRHRERAEPYLDVLKQEIGSRRRSRSPPPELRPASPRRGHSDLFHSRRASFSRGDVPRLLPAVAGRGAGHRGGPSGHEQGASRRPRRGRLQPALHGCPGLHARGPGAGASGSDAGADEDARRSRARAGATRGINVDLIYGLPLPDPRDLREDPRSSRRDRPRSGGLLLLCLSYPGKRVTRRNSTRASCPRGTRRWRSSPSRASGSSPPATSPSAWTTSRGPTTSSPARAARAGCGATSRATPSSRETTSSASASPPSATSAERSYVQNEKKLSGYRAAVEAGRLPVARGIDAKPRRHGPAPTSSTS